MMPHTCIPGILLCAGLRITNSIPTRKNIASFIIKHSRPFLPGNHCKATFDVICCKPEPANFPFHRPIPIISNIDPHEISIASPSSLSPQPTPTPHIVSPPSISLAPSILHRPYSPSPAPRIYTVPALFTTPTSRREAEA